MSKQKLFKNLKLQEKYSLWLKEVFDAVYVESRTGKYIVLKTIEKGNTERFWFLGKSGAIRVANTNASTKSFDFQQCVKEAFLSWEKGKLDA